MKKELTSLEKAEQVVREVCGSKRSRMKKRSLAKMVETDIDIFAEENKVQIKEQSKDESN